MRGRSCVCIIGLDSPDHIWLQARMCGQPPSGSAVQIVGWAGYERAALQLVARPSLSGLWQSHERQCAVRRSNRTYAVQVRGCHGMMSRNDKEPLRIANAQSPQG